ncbi:MAG: hypothetical protein ACRC92_27205 [Peptostreptococcaceae bacterium]
MKDRLIQIIKLNIKVSRFDEALAGMSLWVLIGMMDIPIYATALKVTQMVSNIASGIIQKKASKLHDEEIYKLSLYAEIAKTLICSAGNILVAFHFTLGMSLLVFGNVVQGIHDAYGTIYQDRTNEMLYPDVKERGNFKGDLKVCGSTAHTVGLGLNFSVMLFSQSSNFNQVNTIKYILIIHGVCRICDLLVTLLERRVLKEYIKNK